MYWNIAHQVDRARNVVDIDSHVDSLLFKRLPRSNIPEQGMLEIASCV